MRAKIFQARKNKPINFILKDEREMAKAMAKANAAKATAKSPAKMTPKPKVTKKPGKMTPEDAAMKKILESKYGKIYG